MHGTQEPIKSRPCLSSHLSFYQSLSPLFYSLDTFYVWPIRNAPFSERAMLSGLCTLLHAVASAWTISSGLHLRASRISWWYNSVPAPPATHGQKPVLFIFIFSKLRCWHSVYLLTIYIDPIEPSVKVGMFYINSHKPHVCSDWVLEMWLVQLRRFLSHYN